ncbi:MAG: SprT family zinc-dependent metalloprotease [Anaerolineaceae bacterium]|nr:SprT family zinc-dependent metalloprotease [Anaerolineaceae bacterium]
MPSTETHSISLLGNQLSYTLKYSSRARRLRISVSDSGVSLILPTGFPLARGETFLRQNAAWVMEQLERHARRKRALAPALPKDVLLFHGEPTRVEVVEEPARKARARIDVERGRLVVRVPVGAAARANEALETWLREMARVEIEQVTAKLAQTMRVSYNSLTIRDQRTRWGSCSSKGTLSFNWRLVMTPPTILQYVVIHELAHLTVPNHSAEFWARVAVFYPEYKKARLWLKKNASLLYPQGLTQL